MDRHKTRILDFETVEPMFRFYLNVWPHGLAVNWARIAWRAMEESGKANYSNDEEEMIARSYAVALSLVYYEYCHRSAWHEDKSFRYWTDHVLKNLRNDLAKDAERIESLLFHATMPLIERMGESDLAAELWINCVESSRGFIGTAREKADIYRRFVENGDDDPMYLRGRQFVAGGLDDLAEYESISGLGVL